MGLSDLRPKFLHKAFESCLRDCEYPPNVAQIRKAYELIIEQEAKHYYEPPEVPMTSAEAKETLGRLMAEFWEEHGNKNPEPMPGMRWTFDDGWLPREKSLNLEEIRESHGMNKRQVRRELQRELRAGRGPETRKQ